MIKTAFATPQTITLTAGQLVLSGTAGKITITGPAAGVTISGGQAGRAFVIDSGVTAAFSSLTIASGSSTGNGGDIANAGTLTLTDCSITGGSAFAGGGIYNTGTASLSDCTISGNTGKGSGGGIFNAGTLDVTGCTITGNTAIGSTGGSGGGPGGQGGTGSGNGGGVFNRATANLTDSTLTGNLAASGAALFNYGPATLVACTVTGNTASSGACGIYDYGFNSSIGTVALTDTIVAANLTPNLSEYNLGDFDKGNPASLITGSFNLIGAGTQSIFTNGSSGNIVLSSDTLLGLSPLGSFGGPTQTVALLPGSAGIASGTPVTGLTTDQRGEPLDSLGPDIGAFQSQGFTLTAVTGSTPQSTIVGTRSPIRWR